MSGMKPFIFSHGEAYGRLSDYSILYKMALQILFLTKNNKM